MTADATTLLDWTAARIADRRHLAQGAAARTEDGEAVDPLAPSAARWCVLGGLSWASAALAARAPVQAEAARCLALAAWRANGPQASAAQINDHCPQVEIDHLLDEARLIAARRAANGAPGAVLGI